MFRLATRGFPRIAVLSICSVLTNLYPCSNSQSAEPMVPGGTILLSGPPVPFSTDEIEALEKDLFACIKKKGTLAQFRSIFALHQGIPLDHVQRSLIHVAAMHNNCKVIKFLVKQGYDVNQRDKHGLTPLEYAAMKSHPKAVRTLLDLQADPCTWDDFGLTPLHKAAAYGSVEIINRLAQAGLDINIKTGPILAPPSYQAVTMLEPPLHVACRKGKMEVIVTLLELKADPNIPNVQGDTALHLACRFQHAAAVSYLIARGANPDLLNSKNTIPPNECQPSYTKTCRSIRSSCS